METKPDTIFYVSGHGFGHASRVIEVINALRRLTPDLRVAVRTAADPWLFELTLSAPVEFSRADCDTGAVQVDSLHLSAEETVRRAAAFYAAFPARVAAEAAFLRDVRARAVVADIPPLGLAAGSRAGLPAIALGNFTWDWIYEAYTGPLAEAPSLVPTIRDAYRLATLTLRLPMWGGFAAMDPASIIDVPLVARHAVHPPAETRFALGLPEDRRVVLLSFGGYGLERLSLDALDLPGFAIVTTSEVGVRVAAQNDATPLIVLDERRMYAAGYRYEDLVAASDVVVTKPGYGIIAECAANGTALLYTSRGHFAEYDVLVEALPGMVRSRFIPPADLFGGHWRLHLDGLLAQPSPPRPRSDGAQVVARAILDRLG